MHFFRIIVLGLSLVLAGCSEKPGPKEAAEQFFNLIAHGKAADAYESSATIFRLERSAKYFEARVRELMLDQVADVKWDALHTKGNAFTVKGDFIFVKGEPFSLNVTVVQENGKWRMLEARRTPPETGGEDVFQVVARSKDAGLVGSNKNFTEPVAPVLPTEDQMNKLVQDALLKFDASVRSGDFSEFLEYVSDRWRYRGKDPNTIKYVGTDPSRVRDADLNNSDQRLTKSALDRAFGSFIEAKVDLRPIKGKTIVLKEPAYINTDGVLILKGGFDSSTFVFTGANPPKPKKVNFRLEFVLEGAQWKVFGISVTLD